MRLGPGPVFAYEWLTTTRRWQLYWLRSGFLAIILMGMWLAYGPFQASTRPGRTVSIHVLAQHGEMLYEFIAAVELTLVLLAAPASTAGAVCLDKARGTLDHLLVTDLTNAEIVLGKLAVRLVPVLGLIACAVPLAALASLLGGVDPLALFGLFLTSTACAVLACSLALTLSIWGGKSHEVLMMNYMIIVLWIFGPVFMTIAAVFFRSMSALTSANGYWAWIKCSNPYYLAFAPYAEPGAVGLSTYAVFVGVCFLLSALLLGLATFRIRAVASSAVGRPGTSVRRPRFSWWSSARSWWPALPGPSLDDNPVFWREWHRSRPSRILRLVWAFYTALGIFWVIVAFQTAASRLGVGPMIVLMNVFQVSLGLLLLSVSATTSLAEERAHGSLDVLLCTPLPTRSILGGKWWGAFRQASHVVLWPAIFGIMVGPQGGRWITYILLVGLITAYCAAMTSLGLALATWTNRLGRAVALCVSIFVVFSIGWAILVAFLGPNSSTTVAVLLGSPLVGPAIIGTALAGELRPGHHIETIGLGAVFWIVAFSAGAAALFQETVSEFDRRLRGIPETAGQLTMPERAGNPVRHGRSQTQ